MPVTAFRSLAAHAPGRAFVSGLVALAACVSGLSGQALANLATDGDFTGGSPVASYNLPSGGNSPTTTPNDPPGWTTTMAAGPAGYELGCVIVHNNFSGCSIVASGAEVPAAQAGYTGNYLAVMTDLLGGNNYNDSISQLVTLTAGQKYTLTFNVAASETECGNGGGFGNGPVGAVCNPNSNITWTVSVGGNTLAGNAVTTINLPSNTATAWQAETVTFTAAATGSAALQFLASSSTAGPPIALLDGINLIPGSPGGNNAVPEPASLALLGLGMAGLVGVRRRRARLQA